MKKKQVRASSSGAKKQTPAKAVDRYIATVPKQARKTFDTLRATVRSVVPRGCTEVISYGIPAFKEERVLIWFAAFAKHCSLFPTSSVLEEFKDELAGFRVSKGTVQFPLDKPLPVGLVKKLVRARVQNEKAKARENREAELGR